MGVLEGKYPRLAFRSIDTEVSKWVLSKLNVTHIPTVYLCGGGRVVKRLTGVQAASITKDIMWLATDATSDTMLDSAVRSIMNLAPVTVFMKGNPDTPRCGFSRQIVQLLQKQGITFETFDILKDEEVRQRTKVIAEWPTYPQLYAYGTLLGGLDIIKELIDTNDLMKEIENAKNETNTGAADTPGDDDTSAAVPVEAK